MTRWNSYMAGSEIADDFANHGAEANNYWWGRTRNTLMWASPASARTRVPRSTSITRSTPVSATGLPPGTRTSAGGVFPEGADYGVVSLSYPLIPFASAADYGYDAYAQTPYFREAIYAMLYGTTPGPSTISGSFSGGALVFPFNDDENFHNGGVINTREYLGDFARYMGARLPSGGNARHARAWLTQTSAGRRWLLDALGGSGNVSDYNELPLDYYAPGAGVLDSRSSHDGNAMQVHLQLNTPGHIEHRHYDGGSFQIWRRGSLAQSRERRLFRPVARVHEQRQRRHRAPACAQHAVVRSWRTGRWVGSGPIVIPPAIHASKTRADCPA